MGNDNTNLQNLREEIDKIDKRLHDLIMKRSSVVARIRDVKKRANADIFHPGREADVLRRLAARHKGELSCGVVLRIWRELISGLVGIQVKFSVAVFEKNDPIYWDIARDYFGTKTTLFRFATARGVLQAVANGSAMVGVIPIPDESSDAWWPSLVGIKDEESVRICGRLPFFPGSNGRGGSVEALLISKATPVSTSEDCSFLLIECGAPFSKGRMVDLLEQSKLDPVSIVSVPLETNDSRRLLFLIEVKGFVEITDESFVKLKVMDDEITFAKIAGTYAVPLMLSGGKK